MASKVVIFMIHIVLNMSYRKYSSCFRNNGATDSYFNEDTNEDSNVLKGQAIGESVSLEIRKSLLHRKPEL